MCLSMRRAAMPAAGPGKKKSRKSDSAAAAET